MIYHKKQSGFALLMTLLVVGVVVAVTASIIELSIKQVQLSVTARDSEIAFHAANAGMECARYARRMASSSFEATNMPSTISTQCFGRAVNFIETSSGLSSTGGLGLLNYSVSDVTWGGRCSQMKILVMIVDEDETANMSISESEMQSVFPNFPSNGPKTCPPGARCTIASVTGSNKNCGVGIGSLDTVNREILLEF